MKVRVLHFDNFDGAGGRINPAGVAFVNPVPVVRDFAAVNRGDIRNLLGVATVHLDADGLSAEFAIDLAAHRGRVPAVALQVDDYDPRAIPRTLAHCRLLAIGILDGPNRDPRILPLLAQGPVRP
jgi:hypothetical protein